MNKTLVTACRISIEIFLLLVMALASWRAGSTRLEDWNGPAGSLSNELFIPAIMMNAGMGFVNVDPSEIPGLRDFLEFRTQKFDPAPLAGFQNVKDLHPFQEYHRYLIYSTAFVWRILGIEWDAVKVLILFYLFLAAAAVYGICRLCMNPLISLAAALAFVYAQPVLWTLPILRDFVKAPFILALILLLGITVRYRLTTLLYFLVVAASGLVLGVGLGFRRDMIVFVPVVLFFLLVCRLDARKGGVWRRPAAAVFLLFLFVFSAWPVHKALYRDGYVAAHDTIMGLASFSDHDLGVIAPASYEKHYLLNDLYCTLKAHDAARRGVTFSPEVYKKRCNEPEFDLEMKQAYVTKILETFPGDMLTRAYAAVVRIATAIVASPYPIVHFFENWGVWFTVGGLLLVAAGSPMRAWLVLLLLCYFCGYTSIQFAVRHAFHMSFVPYFFAGLVVQYLLKLAAGFLPGRFRSTFGEDLRTFGRKVVKCAGYCTLFCVISGGGLIMPLIAARAWQYEQVNSLKNSYIKAPMTPLSHKTLSWDGRTLFMPVGGRACHLCQTMGLIVDIETRLIAASLRKVDIPLDLKLVYEWDGRSWDFSAPATFGLRDIQTPGDLKYFFPVHETSTCTDWNHFVGISLPDEQAHFFEGFLEVQNLENLELLVNMAVPEEEARFIDAQYLKVPDEGGEWTPYNVYEDFNPFVEEMEIRGLLSQGQSGRAAERVRLVLKRRPQSIQFTFLLAEALMKAGDREKALSEARALLELYPETFVLYARINQFFREHGGAEGCCREWQSVVEGNPALACARIYRDNACVQLPGLSSNNDDASMSPPE